MPSTRRRSNSAERVRKARSALGFQRRQLVSLVRSETQAIMRGAAETVLFRANTAVPQPGQSQGWATGALRASGHIIYGGGNYDAYEAAISAARSAPGTRIDVREQILPPLPPPPRSNSRFSATVYYPLAYAYLIETGFDHRGEMDNDDPRRQVSAHRGGHYHVPGTYFLRDGTLGTWPEFVRQLHMMLDRLAHARTETQEEFGRRTEGRILRATANRERASNLIPREFVDVGGEDIASNLRQGLSMGEAQEVVRRNMQAQGVPEIYLPYDPDAPADTRRRSRRRGLSRLASETEVSRVTREAANELRRIERLSRRRRRS